MNATEITTSRNYTTYASGEKCNRFEIDEDGTIRAWDEVAGHYTTCHSLTKRQEGMIRAEAEQQ